MRNPSVALKRSESVLYMHVSHTFARTQYIENKTKMAKIAINMNARGKEKGHLIFFIDSKISFRRLLNSPGMVYTDTDRETFSI